MWRNQLWQWLEEGVVNQCLEIVSHSASMRAGGTEGTKLQALVYDILPSTTAVFSYAIGSRKMTANMQFFVGAQTVVNLLQTAQIISDVCFIADHIAFTPAQIKPKSFESRHNSFFFFFFFFFFLPGVDASRVYVRALALGCFYSHISTRTFRRALTASLDSCAEINSAPAGLQGVTKSGRVWRKVPESDARSVCGNMGWVTDTWRRHAAGWGLHSQGDCSCSALLFFFFFCFFFLSQTPSTGLRHSSSNHCDS